MTDRDWTDFLALWHGWFRVHFGVRHVSDIEDAPPPDHAHYDDLRRLPAQGWVT